MQTSADSKTFEAIRELFLTEYKYCKSLNVIMNLFGKPLDPSSHSPFHVITGDGPGEIPSISHQDWHLIFSKIPSLISLHESIFSQFMKILNIHFSCDSDIDPATIQITPDTGISLGEIGNIFLSHLNLFEIYVSFCEFQMLAMRTIQELSLTNYDFAQFIKNSKALPACKGLDLSAFLLEPMQRLTRYPLLLKQILHYSKADSELSVLKHSFKKSDMSTVLNSLETQIVITECNPFSEFESIKKAANPFAEIQVDDNPFESSYSVQAGTSVLISALAELEGVLSRANEAAQRKENLYKLEQLQNQLVGNKILMMNGQLRSPPPYFDRKKASSRSSSLSPPRRQKAKPLPSDDLLLLNQEIIDLPSETKHHEKRIWIKDGILEDATFKRPTYCVLCSDLLLLLYFEPTTDIRITPETKLFLAYKPISLLDITVDTITNSPTLASRIRNSISFSSKPSIVSSQSCRFSIASKVPITLHYKKPKNTITLKTKSESELRSWMNVLSEATFNFKSKELPVNAAPVPTQSSQQPSPPIAKITLYIVRASELLPVDRGITSHPYSIIHWNENVLKSRVIPNSINPIWNEKFELILYNSFEQILSIQLYNYRKYSKNEYLGRTDIDLAFLKYFERNDTGPIQMHLADVPTGSLTIRITYELYDAAS